MHYLWQLFQVVTINGLRHVDHNNNFGNWGASSLWGSFMGLTLWIAIYVRHLQDKHLQDLLTYVNDIFLYQLEANIIWYTPFQKSLPTEQTGLLQLWDELRISHDEPKQVYGLILTIIGFDVDPNAMTITMLLQSHANLIYAICTFAAPSQ